MKHINKKFLSDEIFWRRLGLVLNIVACFIFFGCKEMLPVPQVSPASDLIGQSEKAIATPLNVTASHGLKKKITVSWTKVNNASYYFIYKADTPHSEYVQIDEAAGKDTSKDVSVPAGSSGYFKVAAVNALGEISDLSLASYGTSLATPIITDIQQDSKESSATVYWYMENLNEKSYLSSIQFQVTCYNQDGTEKEKKTISATNETYCTFSNLNSASLYRYDVEAYLINDQKSSEKSLKLDRLTAVSLIPQVADFTATEGTEKEAKITLSITLPQMAKVLAGTASSAGDQNSYEDKPVFFKIQRFDEATSKFTDYAPYVGFNGSTTEIAKGHADFALYNEGDVITWVDTNITRGIKYKYRVLTYVDDNFDSSSHRINVTHAAEKGNVKTGWAANTPTISSTQIEYENNTAACPEDPAVTAEYIAKGFTKITANWNGLGKEPNYKYLILQNHYKLKKDNPTVAHPDDGEEDTIGSESFIANSNGSFYFDDISEIKNYKIDFNFEAPDVDTEGNTTDNPSNVSVRGYYKYWVYVVPSTIAEQYADPNNSIQAVKDSALIFDNDSSKRLVYNQSIPAPAIAVKDGYINKAIVTYSTQADTTYKLVRQTIDTSGSVLSGQDKTETLDGSGEFTDSTLESGKAYQYTVYASNSAMDDVPSTTEKAFTLGTPVLTFDENAVDYDTVTVKWDSVVHPIEAVLTAENSEKDKNVVYTVTHNGKSYSFNQSEFSGTENETREDDDKNYSLIVTNGTNYILKIKKGIKDFDYSSATPKIAATEAGKDSVVAIKVTNKITDASNHTDADTKVHTLGPANTGITATQGSDIKAITVRWAHLPGVNCYAVRRICPALPEEDEDKVDVLYVTPRGTVTQNGEPVDSKRTAVKLNGSTMVLTDTHQTVDDKSNSYQVNQAKIAWGLEFKYTVTPVLSVDDNPFEEGFKVVYTDDQNATITKKGFTPGYGINTVATKAESADTVTVTWKQPNNYAHSAPSLWYRKEGTSKWIGPSTFNAGTEIKEIHLDDLKDPQDNSKTLRDQKVEFAVSYDNNNDIEFEKSYIDYLALQQDKDKEQLNSGYQFTLKTFNTTAPVKTAETFSEKVNWSMEQNGNRKKGVGDNIDGDCYEIQILNKNCSDKWYTIATIAKDGTVTTAELKKDGYTPKLEAKSWYDVQIEDNGNNSLTITALNSETKNEFTTSTRLTRGSTQASAITGEHDGLLKVQRDYKHYYRLVAKRKATADGDEIKAVLGDITSQLHDATAKAPVYSYRKITDDEFVKGITLIVADALNQSGVKDGSTASVGNFYAGRQGGTRTFWYGTKAPYTHCFTGGTPYSDAKLTSGWTISIPETKAGDSAQGTTIANLPWGAITTTHESGLPSYQGIIFIHAGDKNIGAFGSITKLYHLCIQYAPKNDSNSDDKIVISTAYPTDTKYNTSNDIKYTANNNSTMFFSWFPYTIDENHGSAITAFDANQPCYKNLWWEVRE